MKDAVCGGGGGGGGVGRGASEPMSARLNDNVPLSLAAR